MIDQKKPKNQYLAKCFNKKTLIQKAIIASAALVLVLALSLSFYFWLKDVPEGTVIGENDFWFIRVEWNDKLGLGIDISTSGIFALQSVMFIVLLAIFLFLTNDKISSSFIALAMFGGLFNLLQRAADTHEIKSVLDYFVFGPWIKFPFTFNWPDMFVVIGIFGFVISYITITIIEVVKESRREKTAARKKAMEEASKQQDLPPHEIR